MLCDLGSGDDMCFLFLLYEVDLHYE
jgi:hypothetical protein